MDKVLVADAVDGLDLALGWSFVKHSTSHDSGHFQHKCAVNVCVSVGAVQDDGEQEHKWARVACKMNLGWDHIPRGQSLLPKKVRSEQRTNMRKVEGMLSFCIGVFLEWLRI